MTLNDINIGSVDRRQLTLRPLVPWSMMDFSDFGWRLSWRRLVSPSAWWRALRYGEWRLECRRRANNNHRCYCGVGCLIDGSVLICGFGVAWFYSWYPGPVPCWCDRAIAELEANDG